MGSQSTQSQVPSSDRAYHLTELSPEEFLRKARIAEGDEDYFTAYYFANLAIAGTRAGSLDQESAQTYAATMWEKLSSLTDNSDDLESRWRFEVKTIGFNDLSSNEAGAISRAYYTFKMLVERDPSDVEARRYLKESTDKLRTLAFFTDEIEEIGLMPGARDILFVNNTSDATYTELVSVGKIITTETGIYAQDIEAIRFRKEGGLDCHFRALFGKIMRNPDGRLSVYMRGVDPDRPDGGMLPSILASAETYECPEIFPLYIDPQAAALLGAAEIPFAELGLHRLWGKADVIAKLGYRKEPLQIEALYRICVSFSILILSIMSLALGWRFRTPNEQPPVITLIILPVLPFACYILVDVYLYAQRLVIGTALLAWGFTASVILLISMELLLLIFAIFLLAGPSIKLQKSHS